MKIGKILILVVLAVGVWSCGAPKVLVSEKANAEKAAAAGNYAQAVLAWKAYFAQTPVENVGGADFALAAQSAFKSSDTNLAVNWFDQARFKNYADPEMYLSLAGIYREQQNISKELSALEFVAENYTAKIPTIGKRMMEIYTEIKLPEKALVYWNYLDENTKNELPVLESFFNLKKELKDTLDCDTVSLKLLEKDPKNVAALEWNAIKNYWLGETRYQRETGIYNHNKTTRQYRILLKELDLATADLKKSLTYFEKLWELEPGARYAGYFANIYARFGDEKKSKFYNGFTGK